MAEQAAKSGRRSRVREMRRLTDLATMVLSGRKTGGKWGLLIALGIGFAAGLTQASSDDADVNDDDVGIDDL
jgi:hypothetical protein